MSKIRRIDFSPDEFLSGTTELTLEETGAYWKACSLMYSRGGPIADDEKWIARAIGCDVRAWRRIRARLVDLGKLTVVDIDGRAHLFNARTEKEIARASGRISQAQAAAEESANRRAERAARKAESGDFGPTSPGSSGEVRPTSPGSSGDLPEKSEGVSNENNDLTQAPATPPSLSQPSTINHQSKKDGESLTVTAAARAEGDAPPAKPDPKGTRLPDEWRPEGELRAWTIDHICEQQSGVSAGHELQKFTDYWRAQPGAKGRKTDWAATWRNWIRKAIEMEKGHGKGRSANRKATGSAVRTAGNFAAVLSRAAGGRSSDGGGGA